MTTAAPAAVLQRLEACADIVRTPSGRGSMTWRAWGAGELVVLLHGGHGSWKHWVRNIPALARRFRVLVPDLPGMGSSDAPEGRTMADLAEVVARGLAEAGAGSRYVLGGFSFGGKLAGHVMDRQPGRVRRLLLVGSGGLGAFAGTPATLRRWRGMPDAEERRAIHRHNAAVLMIHDPARLDGLAVAIQADNAENTRVTWHDAAVNSDLRPCLERHRPLVTAVWGAEDVLVTGRLDERIATLRRLCPDPEVVVVPGAGHWVQYEAADAVNAVLAGAAARALDGAPEEPLAATPPVSGP